MTQPTIYWLFSGQVQNVELRTMVRVAEVLNADLEPAIRPRTKGDDSARDAAEALP